MKLKINENSKEDEVIINCLKIDNRINKLIQYVKQYSVALNGIYNNETHYINIEEILYIDCTDGRTFLYTADKVYENKESLASLEKTLSKTPFLRISKNCILNTSYLRSVKPIFNHRMEATLINDEKIIISRKYISFLKDKINNF